MVIKVGGKEFGDLIKITSLSPNIKSHKLSRQWYLGWIAYLFYVQKPKGECKAIVYFLDHYLKICVL